MNEILSLQQRIQDTSREYDHEYNQIQELEEVYMQLQRKISFHDEEIKKLREKIQVDPSLPLFLTYW